MIIIGVDIGVDCHPGFQQIAFIATESGELQERRLKHPDEAEDFYRELAIRAVPARVGMEASGHARCALTMREAVMPLSKSRPPLPDAVEDLRCAQELRKKTKGDRGSTRSPKE